MPGITDKKRGAFMNYRYSTAAASIAFPEGGKEALVSEFLDNVKAFMTLSKRIPSINTDDFTVPLMTTLIVEDQEEDWEVVILSHTGYFDLDEIILTRKLTEVEAHFVRFTKKELIQRIFTLQELDEKHEGCSLWEEGRLDVIRRELS